MNNTVEEIIGIAKKSQYLAAIDINKSGLYGGGIDKDLPNKIYTVRKSVEYMQGINGQVEAARALGTITITAIGDDGDTFEVLIDDPVLGSISLGTYTKVSGDTTTTILATNIADEMNNNTYGYSLTTSSNLIRIYAPLGYGNLINGGTRLSVDASNTPEVRATATFNCGSLTGITLGTLITIQVEIPNGVYTTIGTYTTQTGDNVAATLAGRLVTALTGNVQGYGVAVGSSVNLVVTAAVGQGAAINGLDLFFSWNGGLNSASTTFSGGVTASTGITSTLTQFSGGAYANSGNSSLEKISNYLYWRCGRYALVAQGISGEGSIAPITASITNVPNRLDFIVSATSVIVTGQTTKTFADFIGYNIIFSRNGLVQSTTDTGGSYYSWNANTGLLTLINGEAQEGDQFLIIPNEI